MPRHKKCPFYVRHLSKEISSLAGQDKRRSANVHGCSWLGRRTGIGSCAWLQQSPYFSTGYHRYPFTSLLSGLIVSPDMRILSYQEKWCGVRSVCVQVQVFGKFPIASYHYMLWAVHIPFATFHSIIILYIQSREECHVEHRVRLERFSIHFQRTNHITQHEDWIHNKTRQLILLDAKDAERTGAPMGICEQRV